jgi:predicted secreted protein
MLKLLINAFFIYMIVWWVVLFCVLPINTKSYAEAGVEVTDGGDPGAPIDPKLKQKAWTTTWVSAIVFAIAYAVYWFHLIPLPDLPTS